jgi:hypothetical protein
MPGKARQVLWLSMCGEKGERRKSCAKPHKSPYILGARPYFDVAVPSSSALQQYLHPCHCLLLSSVSNNVSVHTLENSSAVRKCVHLQQYSSKVLPSIHGAGRPIGSHCLCMFVMDCLLELKQSRCLQLAAQPTSSALCPAI